MNNYKHISIVLEDGSVCIMHFVLDDTRSGGTNPIKREGTPEEIEAEIKKAAMLWKSPVKSWRVIDVADVPKERTYRNALRDNGTSFHHDIEKAKDIHFARVRRARVLALEQKDKDWTRAMGQKKSKDVKLIEAQRQTLRDIPAVLSEKLKDAKTIKEIEDSWPHDLLDKEAT